MSHSLADVLCRAAIYGGRFSRPSAAVFADYLDEAGDERATVVRGLATAKLVQVANAYQDVPRDPQQLTAGWSVQRREIRLCVRAPTACLPVFKGIASELRGIVVARIYLGGRFLDTGCVPYTVRRLCSPSPIDARKVLLLDPPAFTLEVRKEGFSQEKLVKAAYRRMCVGFLERLFFPETDLTTDESAYERPEMGQYPSVDESRDRLRRARWSMGDVATANRWLVTGTNGDEYQIMAEGRSQAEAWWNACRQAVDLGLLAPRR
jgi:hypothetical protein